MDIIALKQQLASKEEMLEEKNQRLLTAQQQIVIY